MTMPAFATDNQQTAKAKYMRGFDADKNGHMSVAEHKAGRDTRFKAMDTDKNGKLSKEEFVKGHDEWQGKRDSNKDGIVEVGEFVTFFCGEEPKQGDKARHQDANKHYVDCVAHRKAIFAVEDANKDGKVTPEEHKAAKEAAFDKMDKNKDNFIILDEFYAFEIEIDSKPMHENCPNKGNCKGNCKCHKEAAAKPAHEGCPNKGKCMKDAPKAHEGCPNKSKCMKDAAPVKAPAKAEAKPAEKK